MLLTSRSYIEYRASLTDGDLTGVTLDCGDGAAGFVAEVAAGGARALAADPLYACSAPALAERLPIDLAKVCDLISAKLISFK
ncbi:hypothetical protein [Actinomadura sp. HBU206391]|uniref:hypothetical protein n=1 Tax=Actinomadura sp. HBU206391 TaxID=2731692 RepID=UPI00164FF28B|nr:hypothetical protein [Actinomadura sp. HBU206391]MBC6462803.1 hypothetical protein [Actinomadura sp. HBU206391]